jgi:hypothetical protein
MTYVIVLALVLVVVFVVSAPLRRSHAAGDEPADDGAADPELFELEAARDAKYREIRDAELDHQTGKLSDADWAAVDSELRAEAVEILRELDRVSAAAQTARAPGSATHRRPD